jgi:hypothetical protein
LTSITAVSQPILQAANAAASTLQGAITHVYTTPIAGVGFTVTTGNGAAAAGTEIFRYWVTN